MSARSRSQYRDTRPKNQGRTGRGALRWVGQFMALVTTADGTRLLVGTWWDEDAAIHWAETTLPQERPGWHAEVFELQFKDYWVPFLSKEVAIRPSPAYL